MQIGDVAAWFGVALGLVSLVVSLATTISSRRQQAAMAVREARLERDGSLQDRTKIIRRWSSRVLEVIGEMHRLLILKPNRTELTGEEQRLVGRLSSLIDEGRWAIPNKDISSHGKNKPFAYRGIRDRCMDDLVYMHDIFAHGKLSGDAGGEPEFVYLRRDFVSEIYLKINPQSKSIEQIRREIVPDTKAGQEVERIRAEDGVKFQKDLR